MNNSRKMSFFDDNTAASMYLSFDADSTASSSAFKTLDAELSDIEWDKDYSSSSTTNKTLAADTSAILNDKHTYRTKPIKKSPSPIMTIDAKTLRTLPKTLQQHFKAISSTPTSGIVIKVNEDGSCSEVEIEKGDEQDCIKIPVGENKENSYPKKEGSSSSVSGSLSLSISSASSSTSTTSSSSSNDLLDLKMKSLTTSAEKSPSKNDKNENEQKMKKTKNSDKNITASVKEKEVQKKSVKKDYPLKSIKTKNLTIDTNTKHNFNYDPELLMNPTAQILKNLKKLSPKKSPVKKMHNKKQQHIVDDKLNSPEKPMPMKRSLKSTKIVGQKSSDSAPEEEKPSAYTTDNKRKSIAPNAKNRLTMIPHYQTDKRAAAANKRMNAVLKTTLISPTHKLLRKGTSMTRVASGAAISAAIRKSMLPFGVAAKTFAATQDNPSQKLKSPPKKSRASMIPAKQNKFILDTFDTKPSTPPKAKNVYTCTTCNSVFRVKSLYAAHKLTHDGYVPGSLKKSTNGNGVETHFGMHASNQCKYCDKKFAFQRALHVHLMQNCNKIPSTEKRKLQFTELQYEQKAQLLPFNSVSVDPSSCHVDKIVKGVQSTVYTAPKSSLSFFDKKKDFHNDDNNVIIGNSNMQPPSYIKKKRGAHSGINRTPAKQIPCHLCKRSFQNVLEFTNHFMKVHAVSDKPLADLTYKT